MTFSTLARIFPAVAATSTDPSDFAILHSSSPLPRVREGGVQSVAAGGITGIIAPSITDGSARGNSPAAPSTMRVDNRHHWTIQSDAQRCDHFKQIETERRRPCESGKGRAWRP